MEETQKVNEAFFTLDEETVLQKMDTSRDGLSQGEVERRLEEYGHNQLEEEESKGLIAKFFDQFKDFMIIVLIVAAIISALFGDVADAVIILLVVVLNAVMGVFQENKAEEAIGALKQMSSPEARVRRNGSVESVKSTELVPGDIILFEAGDVVPADVRFIEANSLKIEEAALTGESVPVEKELGVIENPETGIGDRLNMGFMNTNVTYGRGEGVVVGTGMDTEVGKIADMLNTSEQTMTPLQRNLDKLGKYLTVAIIVVAIIMFVVGLNQGRDWLDMMLVSISLAVAAIPEGLPAIVTIILSIGTQRMADRNSLVRNLPAVETLGSTDVICSDKTGTLTQNKMTVEQVYYNNEIHSASEDIAMDNALLRSTTYANDTNITAEGKLVGDPTETAFVQYGLDKGQDLEAQLKAEPRIEEVPFESDRKMMSTIHQEEDGRYYVAVKGAPDVVIDRCTHVDINGEIHPFSDEMKQQALDANHDMATQALRVLSGAYKYIDEIPEEVNSDTIEFDLVFAGLVGMIDPERPEAKDAVRIAKRAGIRPVMITGDHRDTAQAIAERLGILEKGQEVMTGPELQQMSDDELRRKVKDVSVYARVSPEHKVRIVNAWQANNKIVAMTGDGVNDAPSLKTSDIGIGMGITGTEVSKNASDMVLADDNFQTIVFAVEEGRKIFSNIQKSVQFLLSANLGEVITLFVATMLGWTILEPVHILWINLVTDTFPAIALGMEPAESDVMEHNPRGKDSTFFSNGVLPSILYQGVLEGGLTLFVYWWAMTNPVHAGNPELVHLDALTMAFATLGLIQLFHAFNVKSIKNSIFTVGPFRNKPFNWAVLLSGVLLAIVIFVPGLNQYFSVAPLNGEQWLTVVLTSFSIIPIVEIVKFFVRMFDKED